MDKVNSLSHTKWECNYHVVSSQNAGVEHCTGNCVGIWEKYSASWLDSEKAISKKGT